MIITKKNHKMLISFISVFLVLMLGLTMIMPSMNAFAGGSSPVKFEAQFPSGGAGIKTFNEAGGTNGTVAMLITTDLNGLKDGVITIPNYNKSVTFNTTSITSSDFVSKISTSGGVLKIFLKDIVGSNFIVLEMNFTSDLNAQKLDSTKIKSELSFDLNGANNDNPVSVQDALFFNFIFEKPTINVTKAVQEFSRDLKGEKIYIDYKINLKHSNYSQSQALETISIVDNLPALMGNAPQNVRVLSLYLMSSCDYDEEFKPDTNEFFVTIKPKNSAKAFHIYSSSYILFRVEYDKPAGLNETASGNLVNEITGNIKSYDHKDNAIFDFPISSNVSTPLNSISGKLLTYSTVTSNVDVTGGILKGYLEGESNINYSYISEDSLSQIGETSLSMKNLEYSLNTGSSTYHTIPSSQIDLTKVSITYSAYIQNGEYIDVYSGDVLVGTLTKANLSVSLPDGTKIEDVKIIPSTNMQTVRVGFGFKLNSSFINHCVTNAQIDILSRIRAHFKYDIKDINLNSATSGENDSLTPVAGNFMYAQMSHDVTGSESYTEKESTISYDLKFPYYSSLALSITNPVIYIKYPKEIIINDVIKNGNSSSNLYDDFEVSFYKLSDGSTIVKFKGEGFYPYKGETYNINFKVKGHASSDAANSTVSVESYSFSDEKSYYNSSTVDRNYLDGKASSAPISCSKKTLSVTITKSVGAHIAAETEIEGIKFSSSNPAPIYKGESFKFNVPFVNNSSSPLSNIGVLIRLPQMGSVDFSSGSLNSDAAVILNGPISMPADIIAAGGKVYYTTHATPGKNMATDGWTESPIDYATVKNVYVDFGSYTIGNYTSVTFMSFDMKSPINAILDQKAFGIAQMDFIYLGVGRVLTSPSAGIVIKDFSVKVKNYVTDRLNNVLDNASIPNNPNFNYTISNSDKTVVRVLKANEEINLENLPFGTYTITRPHVPNIENPTFNMGTNKFTVDRLHSSPEIEIFNMLYEPYPELTQTILKGESANLNSQIPGSTNSGVIFVSSNPGVVTVDANGRFTGVTNGTSVITVKSDIGDIIGKITVTVTLPPEISKSIYTEEEVILNSQIPGSSAAGVTYISSNPNVATVGGDGKITGVGTGSTTITYQNSDGVVIGISKITVLPPVTSTEQIYIEESANYNSKVPGSTGAGVTITSSDPSVATVDSSGNVVGRSEGEVTLTYKNVDGGIIGEVKVKVLPPATSEEKIYIEESANYNSKVLGSSDTGVTITSSDPSVATVDSSGNIVGRSEGEVTLTYKNVGGGNIGEVKVKVLSPIKIDKKIFVGEKSNIKNKIPGTNEDGVTYESSDPEIALVNEEGNITGNKTGNVKITVRKKDCTVIGEAFFDVIPPTTLEEKIEVGKNNNFKDKIPGADEDGVTFESDDLNIAIVDTEGNVKGITEGNVNVTVRRKDGAVIGLVKLSVSKNDSSNLNNNTNSNTGTGETSHRLYFVILIFSLVMVSVLLVVRKKKTNNL